MIWEVLYNQQLIYGMISIIAIVIGALISILGVYILKKGRDSLIVDFIGASMCTTGTAFLFVALIVFFISGLPRLLNPAYFVFMGLK